MKFSKNTILLLFLVGLINGVAFWLGIKGYKYMSLSQQSLFALLSPIFVAIFAFLLFGFSDDQTVSGIFRQTQVKMSKLYSRSAGLYAQKEDVIAEFHKVRSNIGEVWNTLGGETEAESAKKQ